VGELGKGGIGEWSDGELEFEFGAEAMARGAFVSFW